MLIIIGYNHPRAVILRALRTAGQPPVPYSSAQSSLSGYVVDNRKDGK